MGTGPAGPAILFVILFAASIIVGVGVLAFAARCVLVIVQESATGQDEIVWPSEPIQDWLGHAVQFIELVGIWLAPAALAARLLRNVWLTEDAALRVLVLAGPGLWLFFPVGLLSSLSAESRWVPFRWTILLAFFRAAPAAVVFYFSSAVILAAAVVPWYYVLFGGQLAWMPAAAGVSAAALFIYSRLLGRLGCIIQRLPAPKRAPNKAKAKQPSQQQSKPKRKRNRDVKDPWAIPEEDPEARKTDGRFPWAKEEPKEPKPGFHIPSAYEIEGYGFAAAQPIPEPPMVKPAPSPFAQPPEENEPYEMHEAPKPESPPLPKPPDEVFAQQVRQHIAERTRTQPALPAHPFLNGVYTFPFYSICLPYWLALALAFLAEGVLVFFTLEYGGGLFQW